MRGKQVSHAQTPRAAHFVGFPPLCWEGREGGLLVPGKQGFPTPFRKVPFGSRREEATHTAGVNPASPVTSQPQYLPPPCGEGREGVDDAGETGFPPSPLPQSAVWESPGRGNSYGRSESGLSSDVSAPISPSPLRGG